MNSFRYGIDSYCSGMNSFHIKLSKFAVLPFLFFLSTAAAAWKLNMLPYPFLHKKFYFLALFVTPNSSIYQISGGDNLFKCLNAWSAKILHRFFWRPQNIASLLTCLVPPTCLRCLGPRDTACLCGHHHYHYHAECLHCQDHHSECLHCQHHNSALGWRIAAGGKGGSSGTHS